MGREGLQPAPKRVALNMKATPALRARIDAAAERSGLSIAQEVERRLIASLDDEAQVGGPETAVFLRLAAAAIQAIEMRAGASWHSDFATFAKVRGALNRLLAWNNPGADEGLLSQERQLRTEAQQASKRAAALSERLNGFYAAVGFSAKPTTEQGLTGLFLTGANTERELALIRPSWTPEQRAIEAELKSEITAEQATADQAEDAADSIRDTIAEAMEALEDEGEREADGLATAIYGGEVGA